MNFKHNVENVLYVHLYTNILIMKYILQVYILK